MTEIDSIPLTQQLNSQINNYLNELATLTDAARFSQAMQAYLDTVAQFHPYSWHNTMLIRLARPDATQVAGFKKWQALGRFVRKGERGIPILAPVMVKPKADDDECPFEPILRFKVVHVFDIAQTDGEPLPDVPQWKSIARHDDLSRRLSSYARQRGITVWVKALPGETQGVSAGGAIVLSPDAGTKTLIHELAHELMHQGRPGVSAEEAELEAEAVAYVVGRHFGLAELNCPNYLALWGVDAARLRSHFERIQRIASQLIDGAESADF